MSAATPLDTKREIERVFREVHGHAVATLVRAFGDISMAEDATQDAFVTATKRWPSEGIPANPAGWIVTTARNRAVDQFRRSTRGLELAIDAHEASVSDGISLNEHRSAEDVVQDDRLRLIFTCCHPSLRPEHRVALTLRLLGGLSVAEIARAFVVTEAAMAKRLVRAKYKITAANISYRVPDRSDLPTRLGAVLSVLYLIYNAGTGDLADGVPLRNEAVRLGRTLAKLMPDEPEVAGLLALMLLNEARVPARTSNGSAVLLRDQHRLSWHRELIDEGHRIVRHCIEIDRPGPFQLQAAIQAVHCDAATFDATDWPQIVVLYDHLLALSPTPIVAMNRAIAISETAGHAVALDLFDQLGPDLDGYSSLHAARAASLQSLGRTSDAIAAHRRALELATSDRDQDYHQTEIDRPTERSPPGV